MSGKYDDIIHLPHHVSTVHPQMPVPERAVQFAPFAALTGYDAAVQETARLTETRLELDEHEKSALNEKLTLILKYLDDDPIVAITYFLPDSKKAGGAYVTASGTIKKLDTYAQLIIMDDGTEIPFEAIVEIESDAVPDIPYSETVE